MANRYKYQFNETYETKVVTLFGKVSFGATGAPTLVSGQNRGINSITRNSAGNYTVQFGTAGNTDTYFRTLMVKQTFFDSSAPAAPLMFVTTDNASNFANPSVVVQFTNTSGVSTDPGNGETVFLEISVKNSSV